MKYLASQSRSKNAPFFRCYLLQIKISISTLQIAMKVSKEKRFYSYPLFQTVLEVGMYKTDHINCNSNVNKMYRNKKHMSKAYFLDPYPTENVLISCSQFNPSQSTTIFSYII